MIYGVVLTLARSLGEFGAVKVVSGNVLGQTQTATLVVEEKYQNFDQQARLRDRVPPGDGLRRLHRRRGDHPSQEPALKGPRMSIEVSGLNKSFGDFVALDDVTVSLPTGQLDRPAGAERAAASPPCSASSPASRRPTAARSPSRASTPPTCPRRSGTWASSSSTTRSSST